MTSPSKKHQELTKAINAIKKGQIITKGWRGKKRSYFPDIKTVDEDIEVQMFCPHTLIKKSLKWDTNRKKVLVVGIYDKTFDLFDETWINADDGSLIKIKGEK